MSTTFGLNIVKDGLLKVVEVARRVGGEIKWTTDFHIFFDDEYKLIAMDNSNQGINKVKDIRDWIGKHRYPFKEGEIYYTIEGDDIVSSCWDNQSEEMHDENPDKKYFYLTTRNGIKK